MTVPYKNHEIVILTGLSGAGKSIVANCLEDIGFYCVDNLPLALLPQFIDLYKGSHGGDLERLTVVMDIRSLHFVRTAHDELERLKSQGFNYKLIFLDASDDTLVGRFSLTRRQHPLMEEGKTLSECISEERAELDTLHNLADTIIDTTKTTNAELQREILLFLEQESDLKINIISFGFKFGIPIDADLVFDVRYLRNPYYEPSLKKLTGKEKSVQEYVLKDENALAAIDKMYDLSAFTIDRYLDGNKMTLTIAVGCTGGRHRSVTLAIEIAERLKANGYHVVTSHRDIKK